MDTQITLLPDAGPLITLAYAQELDVLFVPGWSIQIVDMVLHEVTRNQTPTSHTISEWVKTNSIATLNTKTYDFYKTSVSNATQHKKANLGEIAIQEAMNNFALTTPPHTGVFLFEDHKIARTSFLLPVISQTILV